jgi:hypothetical protein
MARKMLKRVKLAKKADVVEAQFTVVEDKAHVAPLLALPPAPVKSDLMKRMDAAKARIQAKRPDLTNYVKAVPPVPAADLAGETVIAGKSVVEWAAVISERMEPGGIIDLTDLPAWVSWAVDAWKRKGSPTAASICAAKVVALRAEAEELRKFANMDKNTAKEEEAAGHSVKAEKLLVQAAKKMEKADAKWAEAKVISDEWEASK